MDLEMRDTIAACATAQGAAGIAIIRISGPSAVDILRRVFTPKSPAAILEHGRLCLGAAHDGETVLDECMAVVMYAPKSYTRQDVAELQLHGSAFTVNACLNAVLAAGARMAEPGEFTLRAYLNGRIDLSQAESVMQLIQAGSERAGQSALRQLNGGASRFIREIQREILEVLAAVDAAIDYPEEVDTPEENGRLAVRCAGLAARLRENAQERSSRLVAEGLHVALLGPPNAGKSTLLNALLGEDKAIVTDIPGTTRDIISGSFTLDGYAVIMYDTAGLHDTADQIESLGIERTYRTAAAADVLLWLQEARGPYTDPPTALTRSGLPLIRLYTKADQCVSASADASASEDASAPEDGLLISAATGQGLSALRDRLKAILQAQPETVLTNHRHITAAHEAAEALTQAAEALDAGLSQEFAAVHLHTALDTLGRITGEQVDEALLDTIFSSFCVGK